MSSYSINLTANSFNELNYKRSYEYLHKLNVQNTSETIYDSKGT